MLDVRIYSYMFCCFTVYIDILTFYIQLHALGRYKDALPQFDKAIRLLPGLVMAYVNKGEAQRILGNWTEAIACTRTAVTLDPKHGVALRYVI